MGKTLYLECYSGISGDMTVAALLDLGADEKVLKAALESLPVKGFEIEISRVKKAGLDACDFLVKLDRNHENRDHDMEYLHGHSHAHHHDKEKCMEERQHVHEEIHEHCHDEHVHEHRGLPEVLEIIENAKISARARKTAIEIFRILALAEAKAHGVPIEQVHFHEVGAVDSIVDIVAAAVCLDNLDITDVVVPFVCEGRGTVRCQHGILPVPVPAVINIMEAFELPVRITAVEGELVTPTGAAILAAVKTASRLPEQFTIVQTGVGAGKRNYERPSLLRAMLIEEKGENRPEESFKQDEIYKLETNIDDCTGELLGYTMDNLMSAGARDVHFTPVYMKKNRPAYMLTVICDETHIKKMEQIIFEETTTIGIRRMRMERTVLEREETVIALERGEVKAKKCTLPDGQVRLYPEYESVAELARKNDIPFQLVMEEVKRMS
ncbi:MAG: nickel pincer cofactor biosynthesis protein LarC [Lachnospiraceae bacterium]|nr:nickel pincer cofactor biosynthesis protein LarC [Lachnospiraceae bacterium]